MKVKFGHSDPWSRNKWEIELDLEAFCNLKGIKGIDPQTNKKYVIYPMRKIRKVFKLMVQTMEQEELDTVHEFLKGKSTKYADLFQQIRQKGG